MVICAVGHFCCETRSVHGVLEYNTDRDGTANPEAKKRKEDCSCKVQVLLHRKEVKKATLLY